MATPSQFNRPYGNSAPGQASWEKINRPDRQLGDQSLANRAATPVGRGYYDPARILERVARGRPGTTMQQAQAAIAAEGYKEYDKLRSQMGQQQDQGQGGMGTGGMQQQQGQNQGQGITSYMNGMLNVGGAVPQNAQLQMPKQENRLSRRNQPSWSSDLLFSTAPNTQTFGL